MENARSNVKTLSSLSEAKERNLSDLRAAIESKSSEICTMTARIKSLTSMSKDTENELANLRKLLLDKSGDLHKANQELKGIRAKQLLDTESITRKFNAQVTKQQLGFEDITQKIKTQGELLKDVETVVKKEVKSQSQALQDLQCSHQQDSTSQTQIADELRLAHPRELEIHEQKQGNSRSKYEKIKKYLEEMRHKRDTARSEAEERAEELKEMESQKEDMGSRKEDMRERAEALANCRFNLVYYLYCTLYGMQNVKKATCGLIEWDSCVSLDELKDITHQDIHNMRTATQDILRELDLAYAKLVALYAERAATREKYESP
ncbi:hypothetical protein DM02DRAFT_153985 [Periconia macrospinosa]|uniref:Uncharacterized protein n=1 Tax=Periconia macrospinosa TaxID=97972 RepID=A0A2V1EBZ0_9PLEO|nr:hypothetical protein DM02DRAFT_153985 [Periconia macrospinosa]